MLKINKYFSKRSPRRIVKVTMTITGIRSLKAMRNLMNLIDDGMDCIYEEGEEYFDENPEEYEEQLDMKEYQKALQNGLFDDGSKLIKIK